MQRIRPFLVAVAAAATALTAAGCGDSTGVNTITLSQAEVAELFNQMVAGLSGSGITVSRVHAAPGMEQSLPAPTLATAETIDATLSCAPGGSVGVTGSVNPGTSSASFDLTETFNSCKTTNFTVGGSIKFNGSVGATQSALTIDEKAKGSLDLSHNTDGRSGTCSIDFSVKGTVDLSDTGTTTFTASGTICGIDASAVVSL